MNRRILLLVSLLAVTGASAAVVETNLPYPQLRLKDGLLFTDVTIKNYNTTAGTVVLVSGRELVSIRASLLPEEVRSRLEEIAPPLTAAEIAAEKEREAAARERSAALAERRQKQLEAEARETRTATRQLNVAVATQSAAANTSNQLDEVRLFARQRASGYFRYQDDPHSNIGAVIGSDVYLENPEPVSGWAGRYRVEGIAYRQYINNQASGFGRGSKEFEMLIQTHDNRRPELIEVRIK